MSRLVTAVFYERSDAERAIEALRREGIPSDQIYLEEEVAPTGEIGRKGGEIGRIERERRFAGLESGLIIGAVLGALSGLLLGISFDSILALIRNTGGLAPNELRFYTLMASPWFTTLMGALIGVLAGGAVGWMVDYTLDRLGAGPPMPAEEALVTVRAEEGMLDRVYGVLFEQRARHLHVSEPIGTAV